MNLKLFECSWPASRAWGTDILCSLKASTRPQISFFGLKAQSSGFFSICLAYGDKLSRFGPQIIKANVPILKSHLWCLDSPVFPVSSRWDLGALGLFSPFGSVQVPPPAPGQVSSLAPSAEQRCQCLCREGLYGKTVGRGLEILGIHAPLVVLWLSKDLSSQIRAFLFSGGEGKKKKERKKLTLRCDDRDFSKSYCISHWW